MTTHNAAHPGPDRNPTDRPPGPPPVTVPQHTTRGHPASPGQRVTSWLAWHVLELAGTGVPLVLAVTANGWWAVLAGAVGAGWASHEIQLTRRHTHGLGGQKPQLTSDNTQAVTGEEPGP